MEDLFCDVVTAISRLVAVSRIHSIPKLYPLHTQRLTQGRRPAKPVKISKISKSAHLSGPWTAQRSRQLSAALDFQGSTLQELSHSLKLTLDIYTLDINILDIGYLHSEHLDIGKISISFHHQAAAPNQHQLPASTTRQQHHTSQSPARHPANQLLTLLPCHTHTMAARSVVV